MPMILFWAGCGVTSTDAPPDTQGDLLVSVGGEAYVDGSGWANATQLASTDGCISTSQLRIDDRHHTLFEALFASALEDGAIATLPEVPFGDVQPALILLVEDPQIAAVGTFVASGGTATLLVGGDPERFEIVFEGAQLCADRGAGEISSGDCVPTSINMVFVGPIEPNECADGVGGDGALCERTWETAARDCEER